jgi:hypothetical protein
MEEALELEAFLPASYRNKAEQDYIRFLWEAFQTNYEAKKYEFASLAFHLLYMSFVSFSIWQIHLVRERDFKFALVGFQKDPENDILKADSPFRFYEQLKESQIFRFLKLIGCENDQVGEFSKFVKRRNKIAHPSGTVFFNDQKAIDDEIADMMKEVRNIEAHMKPVIEEVYRKFLLESAAQEELEYATLDEEIEVNFIHRYYMSAKDVEICVALNVQHLSGEPNFGLIESLHGRLQASAVAQGLAA